MIPMVRKGLGAGRGKGYKNIQGRDPKIHSDSARGRKQPQKLPYIPKLNKKLPDQAKFYDSLWIQNKGVFYRGTSGGKGLSMGVLGAGTYVSWKEGMAKAFAKISAMKNQGEPKVEEIKLSKDLRLLDAQSKTFNDIKRKLGVNPFEKVGDPLFARVLTEEVKMLGYDGVISDDVADGIVIFEK